MSIDGSPFYPCGTVGEPSSTVKGHLRLNYKFLPMLQELSAVVLLFSASGCKSGGPNGFYGRNLRLLG